MTFRQTLRKDMTIIHEGSKHLMLLNTNPAILWLKHRVRKNLEIIYIQMRIKMKN